MGSRYKFSLEKTLEIYQKTILSQFTKDLPQSVLNCHRGVSMDICLNTLLLTSLSNSSFQQVYDKIDNYAYLGFTELEHMPQIHYIRKTLIAWESKEIIKRHRVILKDQLRKLKTTKFWQQTHSNEGVVLAFDITERGYFGSEDEHTVYSKGRTVAKRCHAYLSMQIMCPGQRLILDVEAVYTHNKPIGKLIAKMLSRVRKQGLKIKRIYLDRGFYQIDVLRELRKYYASEPLMPAIRTKRVKEAIAQWHQEHGFKAGMLEMQLGKGKSIEPYILVFSPLDPDKRQSIRRKSQGKEEIHNYYLFFCLLKPPEVSDPVDMELVFNRLSWDYRNRWGIETGYRVLKTIWAQTTSKEYSLRTWLLWNAVILYNMWVLGSVELQEQKGIPNSYVCCEGNSITKPRVKKIPRDPHERPRRPWVPRSIQKLDRFLDVILMVALKSLQRLLDHPQDDNFELIK